MAWALIFSAFRMQGFSRCGPEPLHLKFFFCCGSCVDVDTYNLNLCNVKLMKGRQNAHGIIRSSRISSRTMQIAATMDQHNKQEVATLGAWGGKTSDGISSSELAWGGGLPWTPSCYTSPSSASI